MVSCPDKIFELEKEMIQVITELQKKIGFSYPDYGPLTIKHNTKNQKLEALIECQKFRVTVEISVKLTHVLIFRFKNKKTNKEHPPVMRGKKTLFQEDQIGVFKHFFFTVN